MRQRRVVDRGSLQQRLCGIRLSCRPCYCIAPSASLAQWTRSMAQRRQSFSPLRFIFYDDATWQKTFCRIATSVSGVMPPITIPLKANP